MIGPIAEQIRRVGKKTSNLYRYCATPNSSNQVRSMDEAHSTQSLIPARNPAEDAKPLVRAQQSGIGPSLVQERLM
jgi:hypothetical protein